MAKLSKAPYSRLGKISTASTHEEMLSFCDSFSIEDNEVFFDKNPKSFHSILNFYRSGKFGLGDEECVETFRDELEYWMLTEQLIEEIRNEANTWTWKIVEEEERNWGNFCNCGGLIGLWNILENPHSSNRAMFVSCLSFTFIVISIIGMILNTVPQIQRMDYRGRALDNPSLAILEMVCIVWFTLEYLFRFVSTPNKCTFMKSLLNWIDLLAIIPYYLSLLVTDSTYYDDYDKGFETNQKITSFFVLIALVCRILRLSRVLKFARNSVGLRSLRLTLKSISKEIFMIAHLFIMGVLIFSS